MSKPTYEELVAMLRSKCFSGEFQGEAYCLYCDSFDERVHLEHCIIARLDAEERVVECGAIHYRRGTCTKPEGHDGLHVGPFGAWGVVST